MSLLEPTMQETRHERDRRFTDAFGSFQGIKFQNKFPIWWIFKLPNNKHPTARAGPPVDQSWTVTRAKAAHGVKFFLGEGAMPCQA